MRRAVTRPEHARSQLAQRMQCPVPWLNKIFGAKESGPVKTSCVALALSSGLLKVRMSDLGRPHGKVFESEAGGD